MEVDQELDQRLRSAIRNKQLLEFNYQGDDRIVEPSWRRHREWNREIALLASRRTKRQPHSRRRLVDVADIETCEVLNQHFTGNREVDSGKHH